MSQALDIAFFVSADGKSGTYFRYHNLALSLVRRGHEVTIYTQSMENRRFVREEERDGVRYVMTPSVPLNRYIPFSLNPGNIVRRFFTSLGKRDSLHRHQVVHLFQPLENSTYAWTWERKKRRGSVQEKALFAWDWDDLWSGGVVHPGKAIRLQDRLHYYLIDKLEQDLPRLADVVTTCSGFLADLARQRGAHEVEVVHNGFWPDVTKSVPVSRLELFRRFALDPDALYLAFTGFTGGEFDWCLDLVGRFANDPRVRFVCCGANMESVIATRGKEIGTKVDSLGLLSSADTFQLLRAVDIGLLPLDNTAFNQSRLPIKFAEYLAAGLPVLGSDVGEVGSLARKLDGVVLLPAERQGWVEGCFKAVQDRLENRTLARPSPQQLHELLSWPILGAQLERIYLKGLERLS